LLAPSFALFLRDRRLSELSLQAPLIRYTLLRMEADLMVPVSEFAGVVMQQAMAVAEVTSARPDDSFMPNPLRSAA
jgi:hypothetical protein